MKKCINISTFDRINSINTSGLVILTSPVRLTLGIKSGIYLHSFDARTKRGASRGFSNGHKTAEEEEEERKTVEETARGRDGGSGPTVTRIAANSRLNVKVVKPQVVRAPCAALRGLS